MNNVIQTFGNLTVEKVIVFIAAVYFICSVACRIYKAITKSHDKIISKKQLLKQLSEDVKDVKKEQKELKDSIRNLSDTQEEIIKRQDSQEAETKARKVNDLRDRLMQSYRFYNNKNKNPMRAWSDIEKETFDNLFSDYEKLGGDGFMHTIVQPEMERLEVISVSDLGRITELYSSRLG